MIAKRKVGSEKNTSALVASRRGRTGSSITVTDNATEARVQIMTGKQRYGRRRTKAQITNELERIEAKLQRVEAENSTDRENAMRIQRLTARKQALLWVLDR